MTNERREELKRLADAATPGPWEYYEGENQRLRGIWAETGNHDSLIAGDLPPRDIASRNASFIAAARTAVPELLEEAATFSADLAQFDKDEERLQGEVDRLNAYIDDLKTATGKALDEAEEKLVLAQAENARLLGEIHARVRQAKELEARVNGAVRAARLEVVEALRDIAGGVRDLGSWEAEFMGAADALAKRFGLSEVKP